jgi:hypothetical protein
MVLLKNDVMPDGRRFVMIMKEGERWPQQLLVVRNWIGTLKRGVPSMD